MSEFYINSILYVLFYLISVFLICACYILIVVQVRCSAHPYHHGAASLRERKLAGTSLIVALVSLLSWLPVIIYLIMFSLKLPVRSNFHINMGLLSIFLTNSIVNLIIYAMRMLEFTASVSQINILQNFQPGNPT